MTDVGICLIHYPSEDEWMECKHRALVTVGKTPVAPPDSAWRRKMLLARHSPIRVLRYSYMLEHIPSNTATHLCRHVHAQPYVSSLRNDRQCEIDGDAARRDTPVDMIIDVNAEELQVIANKRLCMMAAANTRSVVYTMCALAIDATPELAGLLVPACEMHGGYCHEMHGCGMYPAYDIIEIRRDKM